MLNRHLKISLAQGIKAHAALRCFLNSSFIKSPAEEFKSYSDRSSPKHPVREGTVFAIAGKLLDTALLEPLRALHAARFGDERSGEKSEPI